MKPPASTTFLGIETSCDETAAAVLDGEGHVLANVISSQQTVHERFGGVVPELASRAHIQNVDHVTRQALDAADLTWQDLGAIAVTQGSRIGRRPAGGYQLCQVLSLRACGADSPRP